MKIAVTGSSGFLGSRFIELYKKKFDSIVALNSKNAPLGDFEKLQKSTKNVDVLIHTAFDHSYKDNISGIRNILRACEQNKIKKMVHISTVSVYDPDTQGVLNENSKYSTINDPYSKEKRKVEEEIEKYKNTNFDIVILQPTIIYGVGGNWTKYALHVCKSKSVSLPNRGKDICNAVYVDDVAQAIYKSCISNLKYEKILISNDETINWEKFYREHSKVLQQLNLPTNCNIINNSNTNEFHSNLLLNMIFTLWFKTPIGNVFDAMIDILKKVRAKSYHSIDNKSELRDFLVSDVSGKILEPLGITKKVHSCKFKVDTSKSEKLLGYRPKVSFEEGTLKIKSILKEVLKR